MTKTVCVLGSGLISSSVVNFFYRHLKDSLYAISVGSTIFGELEELKRRYPGIETVFLDVRVDTEKLNCLIKSSDVVISLLPNDMQVLIARVCIELKVDMVHASYCTDELQSLDSDAKENNVTILNEIGLDPGIDHFLAMKVIDELHKEGAKITGFLSHCGGIPEPNASHSNPLRYKFSWSPITSLRNLLNPAKYLLENKVIDIPSGGSLIDKIRSSKSFFGEEIGELEEYPNRDSLKYKLLYGLRDASTVLRGTFRYKGFKEAVIPLFKLGLLSDQSTLGMRDNGRICSWGDLIQYLLCKGQVVSEGSLHDLLSTNGFTENQIETLNQLGILSREHSIQLKATLVETMAEHLANTNELIFGDGERDIVIMRHEVTYEKINTMGEITNGSREIILVAYGEQDRGGFSAMSKTVGLTICHAVNMLLDGSFKKPGVLYPLT